MFRHEGNSLVSIGIVVLAAAALAAALMWPRYDARDNVDEAPPPSSATALGVLSAQPAVRANGGVSAAPDVVPDVPNEVPSDVVVVADDAEAKRTVIELAQTIAGVRGIDGGGLQNSRLVEDITVLLLNINKVYKSHSSIKIVGV